MGSIRLQTRTDSSLRNPSTHRWVQEQLAATPAPEAPSKSIANNTHGLAGEAEARYRAQKMLYKKKQEEEKVKREREEAGEPVVEEQLTEKQRKEKQMMEMEEVSAPSVA